MGHQQASSAIFNMLGQGGQRGPMRSGANPNFPMRPQVGGPPGGPGFGAGPAAPGPGFGAGPGAPGPSVNPFGNLLGGALPPQQNRPPQQGRPY